MRVVGRSGVVMDLPETLARSMMRTGRVTEAKPAAAKPRRRKKPEPEPEQQQQPSDDASVDE